MKSILLVSRTSALPEILSIEWPKQADGTMRMMIHDALEKITGTNTPQNVGFRCWQVV